MNVPLRILMSFILVVSATSFLAFEPDAGDEDQLAAAKAIIEIKKADPGIQKFFNESIGYAVFPSVGKGVIGARNRYAVCHYRTGATDASS